MLYFAYGANMDRAVMRKHAPAAVAVGIATLTGHRFVITADGYASIEAAPAQSVHGVLWRITPRDRATLDVWEDVATGLYSAETLSVHEVSRRRRALIYIARRGPLGRPKRGYMDIVVAAARAWNLPQDYILSLQRWSRANPRETRTRKIADRE